MQSWLTVIYYTALIKAIRSTHLFIDHLAAPEESF